MITKIIEATNDRLNWGKFLVARFDSEWDRAPAVDGVEPEGSLLRLIGTNPRSVWVLDLQTNEGASFFPGSLASADLDKHQIWVCPLFQPFLEWLYKQDLTDIAALPDAINLPHAEFAFHGYRRGGSR